MPTQLVMLGLKVDAAVKKSLSEQAKERGKTLGEHAREILTAHVFGVGRDHLGTKNAPPEPAPAGDPELLTGLTDGVRDLARNVSDLLASERLERSDFYAALANVLEGVLRAGASSGRFQESEATEFVDRVFRKRLVRER